MTKIYERWEIERTHRIGLSVHEMGILLDALQKAHTFPCERDADWMRLDHRIARLTRKIKGEHDGRN